MRALALVAALLLCLGTVQTTSAPTIASATQITTSSTFTTIQGTAGGETFTFASTVNGVSKVDLDVLPLLAAALLILGVVRRRAT